MALVSQLRCFSNDRESSDLETGEMSAINGIAGAMTEQIKVIHVVGQTLRSMQAKHMMIHHSIGFSPDHQVYNKASAAFRVAAAELQDKETAPAQIDVSEVILSYMARN